MYVFIITYKDGSRKRIMGTSFKATNDVLSVIKYKPVSCEEV